MLPRPGIGHRTRQDCHLFLHFTLSRLHFALIYHWSLVYPHDNRDSCHPLRREVTVTASERRTVRCLDADGPRTHPIVHHTQMKHALKHFKLQLRGDLRHVDARPAAGLYQGACWMMISLLTRTSTAAPTWTASLRIKKCMKQPENLADSRIAPHPRRGDHGPPLTIHSTHGAGWGILFLVRSTFP